MNIIHILKNIKYIIKRIFYTFNDSKYIELKKSFKDRPIILHFVTSDSRGGAGRAAYKIHKGLLNKNLSSVMVVLNKMTEEKEILEALPKTGLNLIINRAYARWKNYIYNKHPKGEGGLHSVQVLSRVDIEKIISIIQPDIVHLHWICADFLSIEDIGKIKQPIVWTLHDMWPFAGSEHVCFTDSYVKGYDKKIDGFTNYDVWCRKKRAYKKLKQLLIVGVSNFMKDTAKKSVLLKDRECFTISNIIDVNTFRPNQRIISKKNSNKFTILIGSEYVDFNKGYDILTQVVELLCESEIKNLIQFITFGRGEHANIPEDFLLNHFGYIHDDNKLVEIYSLADVTLVPSRIESFGLVAAESIACGTPVVCFDTSGLKDIVENGVSGYRVECYNPKKFTDAIFTIYQEKKVGKFKPSDLHNFICERFSESIVISQYLSIYNLLLKKR